ncbi:MAG: ribonuclease P protein component [Gammaproteobacteria bacterium]|jgi:ribonuclease P protein component
MKSGHFARHQRLLKAAEFKHVFARPVRQSNNTMTLLARENKLNHARLGLAISKKQLRRAVDRNRIKRLVRESFRQHQDLLAGLDCVVMVRSAVSTLSNSVIFETLDNHWNRLAEKCGKS